jgi:glycosyltransferase involved in cell wall biosynthesis
MHILIVALHRAENPTGVCRHAANLARCLAVIAEVTQITIVTGKWQQHYFKTVFLLNSIKIEVLGMDIKNTSLSRNFWFLFGLPKLTIDLQPDVVHLSFPLPFIRLLFSCPVVSTIHDLYPYQFPENFGDLVLFNRLFLQCSVRNSDALACVSKTTLHDLAQYFPEVVSKQKRMEVIYNFVDFDEIEAQIPFFLEDRAELSFILCVGQHRKNKNIDLLIKAYSVLIEERKIDRSTKLVIVGSYGPESANLLQTIEELSLQDSVIVLSAIDDNELRWFYQNCQLFVIPSSLEGFCIPLVEALYFSCKVVCSDIPIFKEIGSTNCTYFDLAGDNIQHLAQAIDRALKADIPKATSDDFHFTKAQIAIQCFQLYSELIHRDV